MVAELVPDDVLEKTGTKAARAAFAQVPLASPERLAEADAIIFGTPTRFGNMRAQMRNFLDQTGALWMSGGLIGKVGSVFTSTASQHGGQETTITSFHSTLLHQGMVIVGVPYSEQRLVNMDEITGGTPYGASTITKADGSRATERKRTRDRPFPGQARGRLARQGRRPDEAVRRTGDELRVDLSMLFRRIRLSIRDQVDRDGGVIRWTCIHEFVSTKEENTNVH